MNSNSGSKTEKRDIFLQTILTLAAHSGKLPSRQDIEEQIDQIIKVHTDLERDRNWMLSRALEKLVTVVQDAEELIDPDSYTPWLSSEDRSSWASWPWLELYLNHKLRRPISVVKELDRSTNRVLDLLADPKKPGIWDRRGLVVGHVQSGKTQHYTALAAKAIDAGYKVVIILTGVHENLREQTQERIEECISGKNSRDHWNPFGIRAFASSYRAADAPRNPLREINTLSSVDKDYGADKKTVDIPLGDTPVLLVVKKNAKILRNVLAKLRGPDSNLVAQRVPVLVIDDEADHSSVNTGNLDENPKTINELIRKILWCCNRVAFVGYTATPYANIFMDDDLGDQEKTESRTIDDYGYDLFPRAFIRSTKAPSNYIGPEVVFGHDGDETVGIPQVSPLPMHIPVHDADRWLPPNHRKGFDVSNDLPDSLREALKSFVLSVAARMALGHDTSHCSMLVHATRFNRVQDQVLKQIEAHMTALADSLSGHPKERASLLRQFKEVWDREFSAKFTSFQRHASQSNDVPVLPEWSDVELKLESAFQRLSIALVNSQSKRGLDFADKRDEGLIVIAIGGDRLSRGLTLEGLTISYFLRGARAYDTLMQMGRWFGYRPGYAHLCRVYAPPSIVANFRTIVLATEELRREFDTMSYLNKKPVDYGLCVREPRGDLLVTALNKMRRGQTVRIHFAQSLISSLDIRESDLESNYRAFQALVNTLYSKHGNPSCINSRGLPPTNGSNGSSRMWKEISWQHVAPFLSEYTATHNDCLDKNTSIQTSLLYSYITMVAAKSDLIKWTVVVIGSGEGVRSVKGMDDHFRAVSRNRLMSEGDCQKPQDLGRVAFKGVALGGDEAIDLKPDDQQKAKAEWTANGKRPSLASIYRSMRPSTHGLLLVYPIIPATPLAAKMNGETDAAYLWGGREPLIGVAISLPESRHDSGCDYVCTPQKIREIFGELADDLARDEQEEAEEILSQTASAACLRAAR